MHSTLGLKKIKLEAQKKETGYVLKLALSAAIGFCLSQFNAVSSLSPFAVAFVAASSFESCFCAFAASAVGYFIAKPVGEALRYVFALVVVAVFRLAVKRKFDTADRPFVCSVVAFCAILCSRAAYFAFTQFSLGGVLISFAEALLCALCVLLLLRTLSIPVLSIGLKKLSAFQNACICACCCIFLMCFSGLTLATISPARIIAGVVVMFFAQYKGIAAASVCGICAGISLCISPSLHFMFPLFAFSGLVAGLLSSMGQYTVALSFALVSGLVSIFGGLDDFQVFPLVESIIAAAVYAIIPPRYITAAQEKIEQSGLAKDDGVQRQVCAELERAAQKVGEVSQIVSTVSQKLDKIINPEIDRIFAKMQQNVCYGCAKKSDCWNKYFSQTAMDIMIIAGIQTASISKTKLESRCVRPNALMREIDKYYTDFVNSMASKMKVSEMRSIVSDQFASISQFLSEIANQMRTSRVLSVSKSKALKSALCDREILLQSLCCYTSEEGRITVEATLEEDEPMPDLKKMQKIVESVSMRRFERAEIAVSDLRTMIIFEQRPTYKILLGHSQIPFAKNKVSGDCVGRAFDENGKQIALISDGMGTGSRAAVDATMTTALLEKLLSCGFSFDSALKMVNCALMVKSTDESLATVDGVCVNIYTGKTDFYKAGAAVSFIRRGKTVTLVEEASMPIGIIRNITPASRSVNLEDGDIVLLVSDGVTVGDCGWISDELLAWSTNSMGDLAAHIASLAKLRSDESNADDISVVALKLALNKSCEPVLN